MTTSHDALREAARAATPGPWGWEHYSSFKSGRMRAEVSTPSGRPVAADCSDTDAAFIAAASPDVVLNLLDGYRIAKDCAVLLEQEAHILRDALTAAQSYIEVLPGQDSVITGLRECIARALAVTE